MTRHRMVALMARAAARGGRQAVTPEGVPLPRMEWELSGDCQEPVTHVVYWRASAPVGAGPRVDRGRARDQVEEFIRALERAFPTSATMGKFSVRTKRTSRRTVTVSPTSSDEGPLTLVMELRCRQCERCRRYRARRWQARAFNEVESAVRTWFVTLTLRPAEAHQCLTRARLRMQRRGAAMIPGGDDERREHASEMGVLVTRYLKLLRKGFTVPKSNGVERIHGARFRYLCAFEHHRSGVPHVHLLLHESDARRPLRKQRLEMRSRHHPFGAWRYGFAQPRLLDRSSNRRAVWYVTKYIAKDLAIRVRASNQYGGREAMRSV